MADTAIITLVNDEARVDSETDHNIAFRPLHTGPLLVRCVSQQNPKPSQTETGQIASLTLHKPGGAIAGTPQSAPIQVTAFDLSYTVTDADLALAGNWTCTVFNATLINITFDTTITGASNFPIQTATFDIGLLNLLFREGADDAEVHLHLQSSPSPTQDDPSTDSSVSWSPAMASFLKMNPLIPFHLDHVTDGTNLQVDAAVAAGFAAATGIALGDPITTAIAVGVLIDDAFSFFGIGDDVPDHLTFRYHLDSQSISTPAIDPSSAEIAVSIDFGSSIMECINLDSLKGDIQVDSLQMDFRVGMDGSITPQCRASATFRIQEYPLLDQSDKVSSNAEGSLRDKIAKSAPATLVRQYIDTFLIALMRLNDTPPPNRNANRPFTGDAHIQTITSDGQSLVVGFYVVPQTGGLPN